MTSLVDELLNETNWYDYLEYKKQQLSISKYELKYLEDYISNKKYLDVVSKIVNNKYQFSIPIKHLINKINSNKKRAIYCFNEDENMILKLITFLFTKRYDNKYSDNCYSFRKKYTVKDAIKKLSFIDKKMYGYKIDISNYFNSIDISLMLDKLKDFINEDLKLYNLLESILKDNKAFFNDNIVYENKGIMAGTPISSFLANIYLYELDEYFKNNDIFYIRYSDDIIFFTDEDNIEYYKNKLLEIISLNKLIVNNDKVLYINPESYWEFLGFSFKSYTIDISDIALRKIKDKIKRASRKIYRWKIKKQVSDDKAMKTMINKFNKKFFKIENEDGITWAVWYFPFINTIKSLKCIDSYLQQSIRYIKTGKYCKKNYNVKYKKLKELGYRTLVNEYYRFKKN